MELSIRVVDCSNSIDELHLLENWLSNEPELRGRLVHRDTFREGEMGGLSDVLVASLASGGALTVLVQSIQTWIAAQRSELSIEISSKTGETVKIDARGRSADDVVRILERNGTTVVDGDE